MKLIRTLLLGLFLTSTGLLSLNAQGVSEPIIDLPSSVNKAEKVTVTTDAKAEITQFLIANLDYPKQLEELGIEDEAIIKIKIDEKGQIKNSTIVKSMGAEFDQRIIAKLKQLKTVSPVYINGIAKDYAIIVPLKFKIRR